MIVIKYMLVNIFCSVTMILFPLKGISAVLLQRFSVQIKHI